MSKITERATVDLFVNGEQADEQMERLRKKADDLREALNAADQAGDMKKVKKLSRELEQTEKAISRVESASKGVGVVLNGLDKVPMHGLRNTLKHLQKEISMTKPNSEAWNRYA